MRWPSPPAPAAAGATARSTARGSNADCLDILPLEWSGCGRGDYRESPLELSIGGRAVSTDFRYLGCEVLKEPPPSALPVSRGQTILAVYTWKTRRRSSA